jgi:hypothetical protein
MTSLPAGNVSLALLHYPVYNKHREIVTTAVTNLDLHDIARSARTYGVSRYYVVTPVVEQRALAERITAHWQEGWGATYNPKRQDALQLVKVIPALDDVLHDLQQRHDRRIRVVATGALQRPGALSYQELAKLCRQGEEHYLLVFGTGWGLSDELFARIDHVLEPIEAGTGYNHLSVRSAAAIILDRLFGR